MLYILIIFCVFDVLLCDCVQYKYLVDCVDRVMDEIKWKDKVSYCNLILHLFWTVSEVVSDTLLCNKELCGYIS